MSRAGCRMAFGGSWRRVYGVGQVLEAALHTDWTVVLTPDEGCAGTTGAAEDCRLVCGHVELGFCGTCVKGCLQADMCGLGTQRKRLG